MADAAVRDAVVRGVGWTVALPATTARLSKEQPAYVEQPRPIRHSAAPIGLELVSDRPGAVVLSVDADGAPA
jgi:hypothetical protein